MKNIILVLTISFMAISCDKKQNEFSTETLNEKLVDLEGNEVSFKEILDKHKGKTVVIDIWAAWCKDCIVGMPSLKELQNEFPDIVYVFLSVDKTTESWKEAIDKYELQGDHYFISEGMKGSFGKSVTLDWIPRYIVVDKSSNIALFRAIKADEIELITTLKKLK